MEIQKLQDGLKALVASAGSKADASLTINTKEVYCYFRPNGFGIDSPAILAHGETLEDALDDARRQWDEMSARVCDETTKKIALAIIRITHEQGNCTDAALRATFDAFEVKQYSADAVTLANTMAENGPFEVLQLQSANAA